MIMKTLCDTCHNIKGIDVPATHKQVVLSHGLTTPGFLVFNCCDQHGLENEMRVSVDTTYQEIEALVEIKKSLEE